jgi:hypothetical protein
MKKSFDLQGIPSSVRSGSQMPAGGALLFSNIRENDTVQRETLREIPWYFADAKK